MRAEAGRAEVQRLLRQVPFRPFAINMENGDRIILGHPENIAFEPADNGARGSPDFYAISGDLRIYGAFEAVTSVALADAAQEVD